MLSLQLSYLLWRNRRSSNSALSLLSSEGWCWTVSACCCRALSCPLHYHFLYRSWCPTAERSRHGTRAGTCPSLLETDNSKRVVTVLPLARLKQPPEAANEPSPSCGAHAPCRRRGQPRRTALLTRMLRAALTTACCPVLSPQLLRDGRCNREEGVLVEHLVVTRAMMASSTRGTTTAFQSRANHLKMWEMTSCCFFHHTYNTN